MTRSDTARETAGKTLDSLAPYATNAKDAAVHYAEEARQLLGPKVEALGPKVEAAAAQARIGAAQAAVQARAGAAQAAQAAHTGYVKHLAPRVEHAMAALPPETRRNTRKAVRRAQKAAGAARHSAAAAAQTASAAAAQAKATAGPKVAHAVDEARAAVTPVAQEAQLRGAAALAALHGQVTAAEIEKIAAKNAKKSHGGRWVTGLAVTGTLAIGAGVLAWQWWRKQSNPEWLVEPPTAAGSAQVPAAASGPASVSVPAVAPTEKKLDEGSSTAAPKATRAGVAPAPSGAKKSEGLLNGSLALDPEVAAKEAKELAKEIKEEAAEKAVADAKPKPHDPKQPS